jgi:hypothetical protein
VNACSRWAIRPGSFSDAMDELGIPAGIIGASMLRPTIADKTIAAPGADRAPHPAAHRSASPRTIDDDNA